MEHLNCVIEHLVFIRDIYNIMIYGRGHLREALRAIADKKNGILREPSMRIVSRDHCAQNLACGSPRSFATNGIIIHSPSDHFVVAVSRANLHLKVINTGLLDPSSCFRLEVSKRQFKLYQSLQEGTQTQIAGSESILIY